MHLNVYALMGINKVKMPKSGPILD